MTLAPALQLILYCIAIAGVSLVGGLLPNWVKMTHTRTQVAMSLVSGLMLGVAFYHLLPHSVAMLGGPGAADTSVRWLMLGLITMLLLLRKTAVTLIAKLRLTTSLRARTATKKIVALPTRTILQFL